MSNARQRSLVDLTVPYDGPAARTRARASQSPRRTWLWLGALLALVALLGLLLVFGFSAWWLSGDAIAPGVTVLGQDLGGETAITAATRLETAWTARTVELVGAEVGQTVAPGDLGLQLDAAASARRARQQTRSLDSLTNWLRGGGLVAVRPVWTFDRAAAATTLAGLSPQVDRVAVDASVRVVDGRPEVTAARPGQRLNVEATLASLAQDPAAVLANRRLTLVVDTVAPAVVDAAPALAAVEALLATRVTVALFDPVSGQTTSQLLDPKLWGQWLTVRAVEPAGGSVDWQLNEAALRTYLSQDADFLSAGSYVDVPAATTAIHQALVD
ncbi:MAG: peptidoglycan binding domain-containing protein, partial [Candidatus Promineifilaceae bacterium]|nr:peptidoglycan binding domain-containing protein [Candidatus Promineifilaceae bacterium]